MTTPSSPQDALAAVQQAWNAAARNWDAQALALVYTEDALFFGGRPGHSIGRAGIRDYFASYTGEILSGRMSLADQHVLELGPDSFLAQGYADFDFVLRGNVNTRSRLRTTLLFAQQEDVWKLRQHHFSQPPSAPPLGR